MKEAFKNYQATMEMLSLYAELELEAQMMAMKSTTWVKLDCISLLTY